MIDEYQKKKFADWSEKIIDTAMAFLKKEILLMVEENKYQVNFSDDFKISIKEAK